MSPFPPPNPIFSTTPSTTAGFGLPPPPPPPMNGRFGKVIVPNESGEYDPEQLDVMERLLAMYRPQYVPPQFAQSRAPIQPMPYTFPSTTASAQVMPASYGYFAPESRLTPVVIPRPVPVPPPLSGRIMMEETPEE